MSLQLGFLVATIALPLAATSAACSFPHYSIEALPLLPLAINSHEQVAGTTATHRGAMWSRSSGLTVIPLPNGANSSDSKAINGSGHVVGTAYDASYKVVQGYEYFRGRMRVLPGRQVRLMAINDSNEIVGESVPLGKSASQPTLWRNGNPHLLSACCGGSALSINAQGEVVGDSYDSQGNYTATLWNAHGDVTQIGPEAKGSIGISVNAHSAIAVQASSHSLSYESGNAVPVSAPHQLPTRVRGMNDCGALVGSYGPFSDADRAFIWDVDSGFQDLNSLIAADSGWKLESAAAINNSGSIVGKGDFKGEEDVGFLLTPQN